VLPFQLERPEFLSTIFFLLVIFFLFQFSLQWAAQQAEVQINRFHRIDFFSTFGIGFVSLLCYLGDIVRNTGFISKLEISIGRETISLFSVVLGALVAAAATGAARTAAEFFGRRLKIASRDEARALSAMLPSGIWSLNFNPAVPNGKKSITFNESGEIGEGRNNNETKWRIQNGLLEILDSDGNVFSRFKYDSEKKRFEHTNDPDTLSIRSQTISRRI
jgi:hypothetical protein